jgi:hypothetical protein
MSEGLPLKPLSFINPVFAQLKAVLLGFFLAVKDSTSDAFNFYNRAEGG